MSTNAQATIDVRYGAVVVRQGRSVIGRVDRGETGTITLNLADDPAAELPDTEQWTAFEEISAQPAPELGPEWATARTYVNNLYTVMVRPLGESGATHLSIRANDRHWRHDWRHLQRIKDEILGTDVEAVELYPAQDRLVDQANQFHLWALPAGELFPLGFPGPDLTTEVPGARQRPHRPDEHAPVFPATPAPTESTGEEPADGYEDWDLDGPAHVREL